MPTHLVARAALVARDTSLSGGAIAGIVVGCVAAGALILLCVLPFIVRARRLRHAPDGDPLQAEIGQGLGGLVDPHGLHASASHKRLSSSDHQPPQANGHEKDGAQDAYSNGNGQHVPALPAGVTYQQGLPSPISPHLPAAPGFDRADTPSQEGSKDSGSPAGVQSEIPQWSSTRGGSAGTVGKTASRDMSLSDSFGPPRRSSTGFMSGGISEEPEHLDQGQPHRHWSLRRLMQGSRRNSRHSTTTSPEVPRSPVLDPGEALAHAESAPPTFEPTDTEIRGAAYEYYHGVIDMPESYTYQSTPASTSASKQASVSSPTHGKAVTSGVGPTELVEEPEAISPDSDQTISPNFAGRFFPGKIGSQRHFPGPLPQRMDTLPPQDIVADIPSPPAKPGAEPSGNPMDIMKPSNEAELSWARDQEILKIESSPPPLLHLPSPPPAAPLDDAPDYQPEDSSIEDDTYVEGENAPPGLEVNGEDLNMDDIDEMVDMTDYSTPPPSTGPSTENTPNTMLTDSYTDSPSPPPPTVSGHSPMGGQSPGTFVCDTCNRVFDQIHKLNHHRRYHERPHECTYPGCSMRFGTKTHLDRHINDKHKKSRKIYCMVPDCPYSRWGGKSFPRKDNWKRHMLNKHSITHDGDPGPEYVDDTMTT
ncbi:hypothetical protein GQ53DRAFT_844672 [Thozetella sp. PMI_491]|nr:hypothetical protein GQ53DRAFT_844672 [Thozetella sp. PMI_491]